MNDVCRFSRDHVVECSEKTVLSCLVLNQFVYVGDVLGDTADQPSLFVSPVIQTP